MTNHWGSIDYGLSQLRLGAETVMKLGVPGMGAGDDECFIDPDVFPRAYQIFNLSDIIYLASDVLCSNTNNRHIQSFTRDAVYSRHQTGDSNPVHGTRASISRLQICRKMVGKSDSGLSQIIRRQFQLLFSSSIALE